MCMNVLSCCLNPACDVSSVCLVSQILTVPVWRVRSQKNTKWVPRAFWRQMWVLSDVSADSFNIWSSRSFQQKWCQITLQHELAESSQCVSVHVTSALFDFCVRSDCGVCVLTARWMSDAHPTLLGCIQMGLCSVWESLPRQIERGSACPSANTWRVPREAALRFGSRRAYWQTVLLKQASQADLATVSLSGHMRMFGRVLKANNCSGSEMLFKSSYLLAIQPRILCCFLIHCQDLFKQDVFMLYEGSWLFCWEWIRMD